MCINCFISLIGYIILFEGNVYVFLFGLSVCFGGVIRLMFEVLMINILVLYIFV